MTVLPDWSAADFADAFQRHLPSGPVWPREPDTVQRAAIEALTPSYQRNWALARALPGETLPSTTAHLLAEWEASVGLPDPCAGPDVTVARRQAHVVARLTQADGPTLAALTAFAATVGYAIAIEEFAPSRFGRPFGGAFYGPEWAHAWRVTTPNFSIAAFAFGVGRFGERFRTWGGTVLQCELQRVAPAHTVLSFAYAGLWDVSAWDDGSAWG